MLPPGNIQAGLTLDRTPLFFHIGQFDLDWDGMDSLGVVPGSQLNVGRKYFEANVATAPGCWPYKGHPAAHELIDYVKIWDMPADAKISGFPQ